MDESRFKRVEDLFHKALEMDPAERTLYLESECGEDRDLLSDVCALIAADDNSTGFGSDHALDHRIRRADQPPLRRRTSPASS